MHGATGPRRGSALSEIGTIADGALLIRNGLIEECGLSRRVENLAEAKRAKEIDVSGRIVLPAFVDADAALAYPRFASRRLAEQPKETPLRLFSKRRLEGTVSSVAADYVRYGVLTVGAHTGYALDLRDTVKVLRAQQSLQGRPLRIRSVLSPRAPVSADDRWLAACRQKKLAPLIDIRPEEFDTVARAASSRNYGIRLRTAARVSQSVLNQAAGAELFAVIAPPGLDADAAAALAGMDTVHIVSPDSSMDSAGTMRSEIERGVAVALSSGYNIEGTSTSNPQYLLYLACTRLGMTLPQAIAALTWNAACALRVSQVAGSLEPGKPADLVVMDVADYRDLARRAGHNDVAAVMRQGRMVYRRAGLILD